MKLMPDIGVLVRVVEAGSFAKAAAAMSVTPSMVSKRLAALEAEIGVRLLNRTTRRLSLTPSGQLLYERSVSALAELEDAVARLGEEQAQPRGRLRVTAPSDFSILYLADAIPKFVQAYPEIRLELICTNRVLDLVDEGVDVAVRAVHSLGTSSTLVARRIATSRMLVCASRALIERARLKHPRELDGAPGLCFSDAQPLVNWNWRFEGESGTVRVAEYLLTNQSTLLMEAAAQGLGFTCMPSLIAAPQVKSGRVQVVLPEADFGEIGIYLVYPHRKHVSSKVRALVDFLAKWFGGQSDKDLWLATLPKERKPTRIRSRK